MPLWVNKETVLSLRVEDEQAVPGVIIVSDGIFVLCDEIIVSQQCAAELLKPLAWQLNDLTAFDELPCGFLAVQRVQLIHACAAAVQVHVVVAADGGEVGKVGDDRSLLAAEGQVDEIL